MSDIINFKESYKQYKKVTPVGRRVSYKVFSEILREFHKQISDEIVSGYRFNPLKRLGTFRILCCDRTSKATKFGDINWPESNKKKQELIDKGITPKDKDNPDGEDWFIYYTDPFYFKWKWHKKTNHTYVKNMLYYFFKPTWHNKKKLSKEIKNNPLMTIGNDIYS